jgi:hypothetical protein
MVAFQYQEEARQRAKEPESIFREQELFNAADGGRAHQAQSENSARWNLAPANVKMVTPLDFSPWGVPRYRPSRGEGTLDGTMHHRSDGR